MATRKRLFLTALALLLGDGASLALVGPARESDGLARHVVMVLKTNGQGAGFCTGIVLAQNIVLTAAHCVATPAATRVHFRDGSAQPVLKTIAAIAIHPEYRADAARRRERSIDLALVRLEDDLPPPFAPLRLDDGAPTPPGTHLRIAGFGVAREGAGRTGGTLRESLLAVRPPVSNILLWLDDPTHAGVGACEGDSGGPVLALDTDTLVGVTDWASGTNGSRCGGLTQAARIAPQRGWIEGVLRGWGKR